MSDWNSVPLGTPELIIIAILILVFFRVKTKTLLCPPPVARPLGELRRPMASTSTHSDGCSVSTRDNGHHEQFISSADGIGLGGLNGKDTAENENETGGAEN